MPILFGQSIFFKQNVNICLLFNYSLFNRSKFSY